VKIQVLGSGCPKCKLLEASVRDAVTALGTAAEVEKVTEIDKIMDFGVMMTPALVIDGKVKSIGKVLTKEQVIAILKEEKNE